MYALTWEQGSSYNQLITDMVFWVLIERKCALLYMYKYIVHVHCISSASRYFFDFVNETSLFLIKVARSHNFFLVMRRG